MKNLYRMLVGLMALTVLSSASGCRAFSNQTSQEVPSEAKAKKNYYVAPFEAIEVNGVVNVSFSQSDKTDVEVTGPENYLPFVVIESHDGVLKVNTKSIGNKRAGKGLEIKIAAPTLNHLSNRGVGDFKTTSPLKAERLVIENSGVGSVRLSGLDCLSVEVENSGVGDLRLSGKTDKASYESSGVGDVHAKELKAKDVNLNHSGVGDITCSASGTIRIRAKGVGNVKYYGNPQVLSLSKSSVGAVIGK